MDRKRVVYLDQFVISDMMKFLNPKTNAYQKGNVDKFWGLAFASLDRLCKLQLIVCPCSSFHDDESIISPFYMPLKRIYEQLSCSTSFKSDWDIKVHQVCLYAKKWLNDEHKIDLDIQSVINGQINAWAPRMIISVNQPEAVIEKTKVELEDQGLMLISN